jgi:hypothetical protein
LPYYLAELYMPSTGSGGTAEAAALGARAPAEEVARDGDLLRFLRIIFAPGDETCFVADEAGTSEAVAELAGAQVSTSNESSLRSKPSDVRGRRVVGSV